MSLMKFSQCRHLLSGRRNVRLFNSSVMAMPRVTLKQLLQHKHINHTDGLSKYQYTTSVKPHMTPSMQKWKQKKRKSKTQQNKELAKLHEDLVKLLTKRAIEFVKNKSLFEVHGGVVTTHVFTSFPHLDGSEVGSLSVVGSSDIDPLAPIDLRKHSNYVAEAMEAHLLNSQSATSSVTKSYTAGFQNPSAVGSGSTLDSRLSNFPLKNKSHTLNHYGDKSPSKINRNTQMTPNKDHNRQALSISFAEVFDKSAKCSQEIYDIYDFSNFQSNIQKFKIELEMALKKSASNSSSLIHEWESDINLLPEESNLIENIVKKSEVNNVSSGASSRAQPTTQNLSLQRNVSAQVQLNQKEDEVEPSLAAGMSELDDFSIQEWDPYDGTTSPVSLEGSVRLVGDIDEHTLKLADDYKHFTQNMRPVIDVNLATQPLKTQPLFGGNVIDKINLPMHQDSSNVSKKSKAQRLKNSSLKKARGTKEATQAGTEKSQDRRHGHINVNRELQELTEKSFVDVSCFTNSEMVAVRNLQYQASRQRLHSIDVFNKLIHALAKKKDLQTIRSLFAVLRQQELSPTLQTFAGCLECIGRMDEPDTNACKKMLADISKKGLDLKEIANTCSFESDEWNYILKAIRLVQPDFVPNDPRLIPQYNNNSLLTALNAPNEQVIEKNQYAMGMNRQELGAKAKAQLEMEKQGEVVVKSILEVSSQGADNPKQKNLRNRVLEEWRKVLLQSFERKLAVFKKKAQDNVSMTLYPYLKLFPPEEYVNIIFKFLRELVSSSEGYSPIQSMIQGTLGRAVNRKYNTDSKIAVGMGEKVLKLHEFYMDKYTDKDYTLDNHRRMWLKSMNQNPDTINMDMSARKWPAHIQKQIGKFLLEMVLFDLKINANLFRAKAPQRNVPAFCSIYRPDVSFITNAEVKMHPVVSKLFSCDNPESFTFDPSTVPMIVPPVPWISKNMGGLLLGSTALIRLGSDICHVDILKKVAEDQYPAVLDSLNTLSACAWKMNKPILDLQIQIFNNKGDSRLKVAPPASQVPPMPVITEDMSSKDKALLYRQRLQLQQQKQDMYGLWCTDLYRLSIANKFRDEVFWFPHSMDFRGRTYPLPPHFNHLGSDNVRSMLLFAKGKPLGKDGYDWLKIHLINLTGLKKRCSNAERLEYAHEIMNDILDSADNPLTGRKWWQKSDEPWQTLACCMEVAKIERFDGDKENYVCHFPVHQDGSCNGLQHYAALGRDQSGAESVNLFPFDVPKDVYSDVVELVEKTRKKHAEEGNETAKALEGFIKRKVIKQTVMTTVYGVTRYGAKLQIHRQLKDIEEFPSDLAWQASFYLTDTTFSCLREMFTATKDIQDWLTESARLISIAVPVEWVTPLGFPVLQPYFKRLSKAESRHDKFKPNMMKQKNAFPPNYIHSLDSTHMMLTSLNCMHSGITFVSVHDCYWTHACDVPVLNKICREQFVNMHKQPLLEDLSERLISVVKRASKDPNLEEEMSKVNVEMLTDLLTNVPKRGSFDLDNVLKSTYFFS